MRTGRLLSILLASGILGLGSSDCGSSSGGGIDNGDNSHSAAGGSGRETTAGGAGHSTTSGATDGKGGAEKTEPAESGGNDESEGKNTAGGSGGGPKVGQGSGGAVTSGNPDGGKVVAGKKSDGGAAGGGVIARGGASGVGSTSGTGGASSGKDAGGTSKDSGSSGKAGGGTGTGGGTCTASKNAGRSASGTGPHKVVMESNSDSGVSCGTIYRPEDLGGAEKYPIFVWGEGGCSRSGTSNQAAMGEIASHGYFVIADGPVGSAGSCGSISMSNDVAGMAKVMIGYIDWAIAENDRSCSAYYQSLDTTKIAADGFSCGGLMAEGTAGDPRMTAVGITSSGLTGANASFYKTIHTPFKILLGGSDDVAYTNGERDYDQISALGIPILLLSKDGAGHGGDLSKGTGDFNSVNLAWLNWQLKGDEGATGKGALVGSACKYCGGSPWEYRAKNIE